MTGRHADAFALGERVARCPERVFADALEHLSPADDGVGIAADADVTLDRGVPDPQLDGVEVELRGDLVEERLERERGGRCARSAVGTERHAVRLDAVAADVERLPVVGACDEQRADALDTPAGVGAAVDDHAALDGGERAVGAGADLQVRHLRGGGVGCGEVLAPCEDETDRSFQRERGSDRERLDERELAAERTADRLGDHANALERETEGACDLVPRHEDALRARRDDERPGGLEPRGAHLRLEVCLIDPRRPERSLADGVARREGGGGVAALPRDAIEDVAGKLLLRIVGLAVVDAGVDRLQVGAFLVHLLDRARERCAHRHRRLDVDDCGKRLVLDDDELRAVLCGSLRLRHDERDGLAREDDLLARQRLGGAVGARGRDREVGSDDDRDDAGDVERGVSLDASDPGMRLRREDGSCVEQTVHVAVRGVAGRADHLLGRVDARPGDTDELGHTGLRSRALFSARAATTSASSRRYSSGAKRSP